MNVLILGATGMVGQGALRECLRDVGVQRVVTLGRRRTGHRHDTLHEIVHADLMNVSAIEPELADVDATARRELRARSPLAPTALEEYVVPRAPTPAPPGVRPVVRSLSE